MKDRPKEIKKHIESMKKIAPGVVNLWEKPIPQLRKEAKEVDKCGRTSSDWLN